ncbi:TIGR03087 family PEP-CTERM/XrtA system glycosyltransferase [uncultured Erythrobacter sp.]|uniref:TIGR03087 family PEP-CTERM/XrtA system glycosyltransferase n=1 Tax=uncultured Erythrobacter sp. TaxID=263913 RepID=UPI00261CB7B4|nr:TIGR03087 family PEP-CTERM/XrtA system glycosyltransferase [uncultured Erythrobacter sp.]
MSEILFLAHRVPFPPNRGDRIRSAHLLTKLASLAPVHVGCFAESDEDRAGGEEVKALAASHSIVNRTKPLVLAGLEAVLSGKPVSLTAFHSARLQSWVQKTIAYRPITTIFVFSGQMGQYIPADFSGKVIVDLCDVDSAKFEGYAAAGQRVWLNSREGRLLSFEEERLAHRADTTILISNNEAQLFSSRLNDSSNVNVRILGNGIDCEVFDPDQTEPHPVLSSRSGPHFVFTGQMDYPPNEQAALWAIQSWWPVYQRDNPAAELHIVGRNPTEALMARGKVPGVTIWGEVPDVCPFIAAADCIVVPLAIARGVQNKVLEAMAMAKPVVLTPEAATGIDAIDGTHWLHCMADPEAFTAKINALTTDPGKARTLGDAARQFVIDHHDWAAMLAPLDGFVNAQGEEARDAA